MAESIAPGYLVEAELGSGAFGEVLLARHTALDRLVAIKRIHRFALQDDEAMRRFRREGRVLAGLRHPAIVRVYDFVVTDRDALLIMEYVPGAPLSDLVSLGPLPVGQALVVLRDVAQALAAAAGAGVAHRDVKPGNVFVLPDGHAKLGDFGLSRVVSDPSVFRTMDGHAGGTPAYFPPEISRDAAEPDERADAYSFAVMAYEVLTGCQPFQAADALAMIVAHWSRSPRPPQEVLPGIPPAASAALLAGLDKDPARRPLPVQLVDSLARIPVAQWPVVTRPAVARSPAGPETPTRHVAMAADVPSAPAMRSRRSGRKRPAVLASLVLLAIGVGAVAWSRHGSDESSPLRVESVSVATQPASARGTCPAAHFEFVAEAHLNGSAGALEVHWTRPDRRTTEVQTISVPSGRRLVTVVLRYDVTGTVGTRGVATVHVRAPAAFDVSSAPIVYTCR